MLPPATVPSALTVAIDVAVVGTLTVTAVGLGDAASKKTCTDTCKSLPTVTALGDTTRPGGVTVAVIWRPLLGVLKPAGTPTVRILMPTARGWKAVLELELSPGLKTAGLPTIVPTEGVPLVTGTFTVSPPRTACWLWMVRVFGSNIAGTTVSPVSVKRLVVVKSPVKHMKKGQNTKPEGCSPTDCISGA